MIELFSEKTPQETLAQFKSQGLSEIKTHEALKQLERRLLEGDIKEIEKIQLFSVKGDNSVHYDEIEFLVTSRFKQNGDTFLAGEVFYVNISRLLFEAHTALKYW